MHWLILKFAAWGLPEWARKGLRWAGAIIASVALLWLLKGCYDDSVIKNNDKAVAIQVQTKASEAAADATEAVAETKREVEAVNDRARDAAAKSADPLRDGLRELGK